MHLVLCCSFSAWDALDFLPVLSPADLAHAIRSPSVLCTPPFYLPRSVLTVSFLLSLWFCNHERRQRFPGRSIRAVSACRSQFCCRFSCPLLGLIFPIRPGLSRSNFERPVNLFTGLGCSAWTNSGSVSSSKVRPGFSKIWFFPSRAKSDSSSSTREQA
jgi:hypothetical protein